VFNKGVRQVGRLEDFRLSLGQKSRFEKLVTLNTQPGCGEGFTCMCRPPSKKFIQCKILVLLHNAIEVIAEGSSPDGFKNRAGSKKSKFIP